MAKDWAIQNIMLMWKSVQYRFSDVQKGRSISAPATQRVEITQFNSIGKLWVNYLIQHLFYSDFIWLIGIL